MYEQSSIEQCYLIDLPKLTDARGSLGFIEGSNHIPFNIARVYYLFDVTDGCRRGGHAHKELCQFIFAISGSFEITLDDGFMTKKITLSSPDQGIFVCPMIWRDLEVFSEGAVCMVLASHAYDAGDYIHDYSEFLLGKNIK